MAVTEIKGHTEPVEVLAYGAYGQVVIHTLKVGQEFGTPLPFVVQSANKADILAAAVAADISDREALPAEGELVYEQAYCYGDRLVYCRQEHVRTAFIPEDTPALFYFFRDNPEGAEWIPQEQVYAGDTRTWGGITYECLQDHVTQDGWNPNATPALWVVPPTGCVWEAGIQVTVDQQYCYPTAESTSYRVLQAHTTQVGWEPPNAPALWEEVV
ncbi:MAG: carbohydrate-binding protein [Planctomycetota bacterium]|jgi:hypothetical protein